MILADIRLWKLHERGYHTYNFWNDWQTLYVIASTNISSCITTWALTSFTVLVLTKITDFLRTVAVQQCINLIRWVSNNNMLCFTDTDWHTPIRLQTYSHYSILLKSNNGNREMIWQVSSYHNSKTKIREISFRTCIGLGRYWILASILISILVDTGQKTSDSISIILISVESV